jgi:cytoskeletal protein CcmA (bactofilin family)
MRKKLSIVAGLVLAGSLLIPASALAFGAMADKTNTVSKGQTHQGTLYAVGSAVDVAGEIKGDLVCVGSTITVSGTVDGDVLCAGSTVSISGHVTGDVRIAGSDLTISGKIDHNLNAMGGKLTIDSKAALGEDVAYAGSSAIIDGNITRELYGAMSTLTLNSVVGNNVTIWPGAVTLGDNAKVKGDFNYTTDSALSVDQAKVGGKINFHETPKVTKSPREEFQAWAADFLYWIVAVLLIALSLVWLAPRAVKAITAKMRGEVGSSIGWGFLSVFVGPILVLALLITTLAAPIGFIVFALWVVGLCLAGSLAGLAAGQLILGKLNWHADSLPWAALVGVSAVMVASALPVVGWMVSMMTAIWAMGGVILAWRENR